MLSVRLTGRRATEQCLCPCQLRGPVVHDRALLSLAAAAAYAGRMAVESTDQALMLRYAEGDTEAFEMLYERHRRPVYAYLLRNTGGAQDADDIFQEVWQRVIRNRERYRPTAKFSTYLFHIARNCFVDHCRRTGRHAILDSIDADDGPELATRDSDPPAQVAAADLALRLGAAIAGLPANQRDAFLLHEEGGLTLDEIAFVTGTGRETVKSRLRYAVAKLRMALADVSEHQGVVKPR